MMNFEKLRIFYKTAMWASYELASENLNVPIEQVKKVIEDIEEDLKIFLFFSENNKLLLTVQGKFLYGKAKVILQECDSINYSFSDNKNDPSGLLIITATSGIANFWLPQYLKGFLDTYPQMSIDLLVEDKETDFNLRKSDVSIRPFVGNIEHITQHYLMTWHVGLYASSEYIAKFGTPRTIEDLDGHRLLVLGEQSISYKNADWALYLGKKQTELPRNPYFKSSSGVALIDCAVRGLGIASLSEELAVVQEKRLVRVLPHVKGPAVDVFYSYPSFLEMSKRILAFRDYLTLKIGNRTLS